MSLFTLARTLRVEKEQGKQRKGVLTTPLATPVHVVATPMAMRVPLTLRDGQEDTRHTRGGSFCCASLTVCATDS
jgi:hypothetical protein